MSYKTLLVHVDDTKNVDTRTEIAVQLALTEDAHLIGAAMTGVSRFLFESVSIDPGYPGIMTYLDTLRQRANGTLQRFENNVQRAGVGSYETRLTDDEAAGGLSLQARYCDLTILGQYDPDDFASSTYANVPEDVVINSGCPALVVPYAGSFVANIGERVLIAWNGSMEAARTVRHALPLLQRAKTVEIAIFNSASEPDVYGEQPGADIALYLARHNVKVDVRQETVEIDIGNALLSLVADLNSDLLVMGCFGHTRFREILLGGVTRAVLQSMTIPVFMSH